MSTILAVYFCEWVVETENSAIEDKKFFVLSDRTRAHPNNAATKLIMRSEPCEICCPSLRAPDNASLSYKSCPSVVFLSGNVISYKNVSFCQIIYIFLICVCVLVFIKMSIHRVKFLSDDDESLLTSTDTVICLFSVFNATPGTSSDSPCDFSQVIQS